MAIFWKLCSLLCDWTAEILGIHPLIAESPQYLCPTVLQPFSNRDRIIKVMILLSVQVLYAAALLVFTYFLPAVIGNLASVASYEEGMGWHVPPNLSYGMSYNLQTFRSFLRVGGGVGLRNFPRCLENELQLHFWGLCPGSHCGTYAPRTPVITLLPNPGCVPPFSVC